MGETEPESKEALPPTALWITEIWKENRKIFKVLITHPLLFSIPIGSLLLFDYVIRQSSLGEPEKNILLRIDFYGVAIILAIFTISFIIEIVVLAVWKVKQGHGD